MVCRLWKRNLVVLGKHKIWFPALPWGAKRPGGAAEGGARGIFQLRATNPSPGLAPDFLHGPHVDTQKVGGSELNPTYKLIKKTPIFLIRVWAQFRPFFHTFWTSMSGIDAKLHGGSEFLGPGA